MNVMERKAQLGSRDLLLLDRENLPDAMRG